MMLQFFSLPLYLSVVNISVAAKGCFKLHSQLNYPFKTHR